MKQASTAIAVALLLSACSSGSSPNAAANDGSPTVSDVGAVGEASPATDGPATTEAATPSDGASDDVHAAPDAGLDTGHEGAGEAGPPDGANAANCPRGTTYADGCPNAPSGAAPLPTLLSSYASRPPWNVAGVDYAVGIPAGTTLRNPSTIGGALTLAKDVDSGIVLTLSSVPSWIVPGMYVFDFSHTNAIPIGTKVISVSTTTVTLSASVVAYINGSSDAIGFSTLAGVFVGAGYASSTLDSTSAIIVGSNVTLSGYDFSLDGGWQLAVVSGSSITVAACNFAVGTNLQQPLGISSSASDVAIIDNHIDGAGLRNADIGYGLITSNATGATTIEYNWIENAYSEDLVMGNVSSAAASYVIQYNAIENAGFGASAGAHGDWIQIVNQAGDQISSARLNFNTWIQNAPLSQADGAQGLSLASANTAQGPILSESANNNTMVTVNNGGDTEGYLIIVDTTNLDGTATVQDNYIDTTGTAYNWIFVGNYDSNGAGDGPYSGTATVSGNVNMVTGAALMP